MSDQEIHAVLGFYGSALTTTLKAIPVPKGAPDLASAYWDGYRAAVREMEVLLLNPKAVRLAILAVRTGQKP